MSTTYVPIDVNFTVLPNHHATPSNKPNFASLGNRLIPAPLFDIESSISQLSDADKALAWIELQITCFKTKQRQIGVIRNRYLPVSKLPAEVLSLIFRCHQTSELKEHLSSGMKKWLGFSQVCHTWRQTALEDAQLWSCPPMGYHALCKEFIARAGRYPLDIPDHSQTTWNLAGLIFEKDTRLRKLKLREISRNQIDKHFPNVSFDFLERLSIRMSQIEPGDSTTFPLIMAPRLQRLSIYSCIYPLHVQPLKHLTHLKIILICDQNVYIPVGTLLKVIAEAPNLAYIKLFGAFEEDPGFVPTDLRIPLTRLISLVLIDNMVSILQFLAGIELPTTTLARNPGYLRSKRLQRMLVNQEADGSQLRFSITLDNGHDKNEWDLTEDDLLIELKGIYNTDPSLHDSCLSQLWNCISLDDVRYLEAADLENWSVPSSLPSLTEITVLSSIRALIRTFRRSSDSSSTSRAIFPQLSVIETIYISLESDCAEEGCDLIEFAEMLGKQRRLGTPLQKVIVHMLYDDSKERMEEMKEVLENYGISMNLYGRHY